MRVVFAVLGGQFVLRAVQLEPSLGDEVAVATDRSPEETSPRPICYPSDALYIQAVSQVVLYPSDRRPSTFSLPGMWVIH